jgi:hypothetical protein
LSWRQENKWKEAIRYYDPIVKKNSEHILTVPAIVLANLCVSYIMTSQNDQAEELMRKIEKEVSHASLPLYVKNTGEGLAFKGTRYCRDKGASPHKERERTCCGSSHALPCTLGGV